VEALATQEASSAGLHGEGRGMHAGRDPEHATETGHPPGGRELKELLFPNVSCPKEGQQAEACDKPKKLNKPVNTEHFKMEGIHMLKDLLRTGDWMAKIDLKDAYVMIPIAQEDRDFLNFQWKNQTYQFNCLPFRFSSAPWVFTKTTRPVVAILREMGLCMIIYIDDTFVMPETETLLKDHITAVIYLLENLGFVINHPKSELNPTEEMEFIGFTVNSTRMELKLPGEKIKKIRAEAGKVL
jgi:hypothetical protein